MLLFQGVLHRKRASSTFHQGCLRYHPGTRSWRKGAGDGFSYQPYSATLMGEQLFVWSGHRGAGMVADGEPGYGGIYDLASDSWCAVARQGAPVATWGQSVVWTGSEILLWGGATTRGSVLQNGGAAYDPVKKAWRPLPTSPIAGRQKHGAVWTGSEMLVWGGVALDTSMMCPEMLDGARLSWPAGA
jgi:hypothetical protein